jgi:hypothetical protein
MIVELRSPDRIVMGPSRRFGRSAGNSRRSYGQVPEAKIRFRFAFCAELGRGRQSDAWLRLDPGANPGATHALSTKEIQS